LYWHSLYHCLQISLLQTIQRKTMRIQTVQQTHQKTCVTVLPSRVMNLTTTTTTTVVAAATAAAAAAAATTTTTTATLP
jgi:hypothetical protein